MLGGEPSRQGAGEGILGQQGSIGAPAVAGMPPTGLAGSLDSRGKVIFEESYEEMELERVAIKRGGLLMASLAAPICLLYFLLYPYVPSCRSNLILMIISTVSLLVALGFWFYTSAFKIRPWRMYESGVAFTTYPIALDRYYPYSEILYIREMSNFMIRDGVAVRWPGGDGINLFMASPRTKMLVDFLKSKMGKSAVLAASPAQLTAFQQIESIAAGKPQEPTPFEPVPFAHENKFYLAALVIAFPLTMSLLLLLPRESWGSYWFVPLAAYPLMAVNCLGLGAVVMKLYVRAKKLQVRHSPKVIGTLLLCLNLIIVAEVGFADPLMAAFDDHTIELVSTPAPAATAGLPDNMSGLALDVFESITVASGQHKVLENCAINFQCSRPRELSLWVAEGGSLEARNCVFRAGEAGRGFGCEFHGAAALVNCTFNNVWGDPDRLNGDGGIEIWSSDVRLSGCRVTGAATNGLFIVGCDPVINDTMIADCGDETVEMHRARPLFRNCNLRNAGWGVIAWDGSYLRMEGCYISTMNDTGIDLVHSNAEVLNCTLEDIHGAAINLHASELVSSQGTRFSRVGEEVTHGSTLGSSYLLCPIYSIMVSIMTMVDVMMVSRQRMVASRKP